MTSIGELRRRGIEGLFRPSYSFARNDMVLLNDNANLFGTNPAVQQVAKNFDFGRMWAYPSENSDALRERIASHFNISPDEVLVGCGSDELLDIVSKCFYNPGDRFCSPSPTFGMYKFYARVNLAEVVEKPLGPGFSLDPDSLLDEDAKLTAICQPNNPTSNLFDVSAVRRVIDESKGVVLLDEAYGDFCGSDMMRDVLSSERGIDVRTMSKAYGLAGARAGFAVARKEIITELRRVRTPFGLNSFTEAVAIRAFDNLDWVQDTVRRMKVERQYLDAGMKRLGLATYPSECNFLIAKCPCDGPSFVTALRERGVAVRDCSTFPTLKDHIRVTIGPRDMMDRFLETTERLLGGD